MTFMVFAASGCRGCDGSPCNGYIEHSAPPEQRGYSGAESKISDELLQKKEADEAEYSVMVWLKDIDYETVNQEVEAVTHNTWSDIEQAENDVYLARGERMVQSMAAQAADSEAQLMFDQQTVTELSRIQVQVDAMIMAERQISSETYMRQNVRVVAEYDLQEDVEYVSMYAPAYSKPDKRANFGFV